MLGTIVSFGVAVADSTRPAMGATEMLRPGEGIGAVDFGMTREEVRETWGAPEREFSGSSIWEYYSRCASLTFGADGRLKGVAVGNSNDRDDSLARCKGARVGEQLSIGDPIDRARALFPDGRERALHGGGTAFFVRDFAGMHFAPSGELYFAAAGAPRPQEDPGDEQPAGVARNAATEEG